MKKKTTKKKETVLSVLKDIRKQNEKVIKMYLMMINPKFGYETKPVVSLHSEKDVSKDEIVIDIPETTMEEIVNKCDNKTSKGTPLLWNISWYKKEDFYTKEKTRPGRYVFSKKLIEESRSKTWKDQEELLKEKGAIRLNAVEVIYILYKHELETGERLLDYKDDIYSYYWTSSRASDGRFVNVGGFNAYGVFVHMDHPGLRYSHLGVCFSRRLEFGMTTSSAY